MIRWKFTHVDIWTYKFEIYDEYNSTIFSESEISSPAQPILMEIFFDYYFAMNVNNTGKLFNIESLSSEDRMDLMMASLFKLEDD